MPQQAATIENLGQAFEMVKAMQGDGLEWGEDYRPLARQALAGIIEGRMAEAVERWLDSLGVDDVADPRVKPEGRNGHCRRHLLTELGDIELAVPRTRRYCPVEVVRAYARRAPEIDRVIMAGFVLGLSTRKLGEVLLGPLGRPVSATTVSRVAKTLDAAVAAFHRRPLKDGYKAFVLDGVVLSRKTGAGALKRPVLAALGLRPDIHGQFTDGERPPLSGVAGAATSLSGGPERRGSGMQDRSIAPVIQAYPLTIAINKAQTAGLF